MTDAELSISDATLIARLLMPGGEDDKTCIAAADRIEALIAERDEARAAWELEAAAVKRFAERHERHLVLGAETRARAERLEATLREIAAEAIVTVHTHNKGGINYTRMYEDWRKLAVKRIDIARATLAELKLQSIEFAMQKGESHE